MKPKLNNIIVYAICGLLAISILFFLLAFAYSSLDSASGATLKKRVADYETKARTASNQEASRAQWQHVNDIVENFKKEYFMQMDQYTDFCIQLPIIVAKNRLRIIAKKTIKYAYSQVFPDMNRITVTFAATGTYSDFKQFIHEITMQIYPKKMVLFRNIQINKQVQGDIIGEFTMEVYLAN